MIDLTTCCYNKIIENYDLLDTPDSEITKIRIEYLYKLYNLCSDNIRYKYIKHMERILDEKFNMPIYLTRNIDEIIEHGKKLLTSSKNERLLGECLPIILMLEKELLNLLQKDVNDNIEEWMIDYLKKYDNRLRIDKNEYDAYDIFNSYSKIGMRRYKFKMFVFGIKIGSILSNQKEK